MQPEIVHLQVQKLFKICSSVGRKGMELFLCLRLNPDLAFVATLRLEFGSVLSMSGDEKLRMQIASFLKVGLSLIWLKLNNMNLLDSFINTHLPTAKKQEELSKSMISYSGEDKIIVIGLGNINGVITEKKKAEILKQFNPTQRVYFFTLFETRESLQKYIDSVAWGSYVWIAKEPEHTIHFDDKPTIKARH